MGYKEIGLVIRAVCDECGDHTTRERDILERIGWELMDTSGGRAGDGEKYAYCPDCSDELSTYEKFKGGSDEV